MVEDLAIGEMPQGHGTGGADAGTGPAALAEGLVNGHEPSGCVEGEGSETTHPFAKAASGTELFVDTGDDRFDENLAPGEKPEGFCSPPRMLSSVVFPARRGPVTTTAGKLRAASRTVGRMARAMKRI